MGLAKSSNIPELIVLPANEEDKVVNDRAEMGFPDDLDKLPKADSHTIASHEWGDREESRGGLTTLQPDS